MFVGRAHELGLINAQLSSSLEGKVEVSSLVGPGGIGKSRLGREIGDHARALGFAVGFGRAFELGGAPAFWPWMEALESLREDPRVAALAEDALSSLRPARGFEPDAGQRFAQFDALRAALQRAAAAAPVCLLIDDLHAADVPSILLAAFLARVQGRGRLFILLLARDVPAEASSQEAATRLAALVTSYPSLALGGLSNEEVAVLAEHIGGRPLGPAAAATLAEATQGNPFFVSEIAGALEQSASSDVAAEFSAAPARVRELLRRQVARLSAPTARALRVGAVLGRESSVAFLASVAELEPAAVLVACEEAPHIVSLVDGRTVRFVHVLVCDALATELSSTERLHTHARAAEAILASGRDDDGLWLSTLARHAVLAAPLGQSHRERAISVQRRAGARAMRAFAYEEAARFFEGALALRDEGGSPVERVELMVALGEALRAAGDPRAVELLAKSVELASTLAQPEPYARAALAFASLRELTANEPRKVQALEQAVHRLGGQKSELTVRLLARLARDLVTVPESTARRDMLSAAAVSMARELSEPRSLAMALDARLAALYGPDNQDERLHVSDEILTLARDSGELEREIAGLGWKLSALIERGEMDHARTLAELHAQLADELRLTGPRVNGHSRRAALAFFAGRVDLGISHAQTAREVGQAGGDASSELLFRAQLVPPAILTGRHDWLREALPILDAATARVHSSLLRAMAAWARAALGQREEARLALSDLASASFTNLPRDFVYTGTLAVLAELCALLGATDQAALLAPLLTPFRSRNATCGTSSFLGSVAFFEARLRRLLGEDEDADALFRDAHAKNVAMGAAPWAERCTSELAASHAASRAEGAPAALAPARHVARMRRSGDSWELAFDGRTVSLRHQRGFELLARIVAADGAELHSLDLAGGDDAELRAGLRRQAGLEALDDRAKRELRARLEDLDDAIAEGDMMNDLGRATRAREERDKLASHLSQALGLGGRDRRAADAKERARIAVAVAIRRGVSAIAAHLPPLGEHLSRAVRTGARCRYERASDISLEVTM